MNYMRTSDGLKNELDHRINIRKNGPFLSKTGAIC